MIQHLDTDALTFEEGRETEVVVVDVQNCDAYASAFPSAEHRFQKASRSKSAEQVFLTVAQR